MVALETASVLLEALTVLVLGVAGAPVPCSKAAEDWVRFPVSLSRLTREDSRKDA